MQLTYDDWRARASQMTFRDKAFINGQFVAAQSGEVFDSINPATGEVLAQVASCDAADVDRAVAAARTAFDAGHWASWCKTR